MTATDVSVSATGRAGERRRPPSGFVRSTPLKFLKFSRSFSFFRLLPPDITEMIIPINCVPSSGGAPDSKREWAMVELQGEIQRRDGDPNSPGYDLGQFSRNDKTGNLLLTIGYHQLEGVEQPLKKPFAILKKSAEGGDGPGSYDVCGFVVSIRQFVRSESSTCSRSFTHLQVRHQEVPVQAAAVRLAST